MSAHKPLIATCYGGSPEAVVDGETGYLVNPFDTQHFAARLLELLRDPALCQRMGEAGYQRVRAHFSLEQQVAAMLQHYTHAISAGGVA
jgi:glycosyltransferase involved in cell wall biosynthesis